MRRRQLGAHLRHFIIKTSDFPLRLFFFLRKWKAQINHLMNESTEAGGLRRSGKV